MAEFIKGDIVVIPFPFSNLSQVKKRPAFVVSKLSGDDIILCQITSQKVKDKYSINLNKADFIKGELSTDSNIRPNRIFTADFWWSFRYPAKLNLLDIGIIDL